MTLALLVKILMWIAYGALVLLLGKQCRDATRRINSRFDRALRKSLREQQQSKEATTRCARKQNKSVDEFVSRQGEVAWKN